MICLALVVATAAELPAQRTGSRIGRTAQAGNIEDAELALDIMARCVASRRPTLVRRWLLLLPGTSEERALLRSQNADLSICLDSDELVMDGHAVSFRPPLLRRPVALAAVRLRLADAPAAATFARNVEPWFEARIASLAPDAPLDRASLIIQDFGHCVALAAWADARALLAAPEGSPEETALIQRLTPVLGPCLSEGATINITRRNLRLILAEPFYHLMEAAASPAAPRP